MSEPLTFWVPGTPVGQPRIKAFVRPGCDHAGVYTPKTADAWRALIVLHAQRAHAGRPPLYGPVRVDATIFLHRPAARCARRYPQGVMHAPVKPDLDNAWKVLGDGLVDAGVLEDDRLVCDGRTRKFYHAVGGQPGMLVEITELPGVPDDHEFLGTLCHHDHRGGGGSPPLAADPSGELR